MYAKENHSHLTQYNSADRLRMRVDLLNLHFGSLSLLYSVAWHSCCLFSTFTYVYTFEQPSRFNFYNGIQTIQECSTMRVNGTQALNDNERISVSLVHLTYYEVADGIPQPNNCYHMNRIDLSSMKRVEASKRKKKRKRDRSNNNTDQQLANDWHTFLSCTHENLNV